MLDKIINGLCAIISLIALIEFFRLRSLNNKLAAMLEQKKDAKTEADVHAMSDADLNADLAKNLVARGSKSNN